MLAVLYGRTTEQSIIGRLLADARAGHSGVLVLRGDPGTGKTALLDDAAAAAGAVASGDAVSGGAAPAGPAAPGMAALRVIRGAGVQSEAELPFAGLHLLFRSALDQRSALPQPQQAALSAALGWRDGPYNRLLLGLAVLSLLAELAKHGPLACLVDDAQWLDRASAEALVFAARRLGDGGIALLFAARDHDTPFPTPGLPELRLGGLDAAAAAALLSEHEAGLAPEARCRILAQARGNPLGLIELSAAYRGVSLTAAGSDPGALALTGRLREAFGGQVCQLPEATQTLLLVAAAEASGDLGVVLEAAAMLGVGTSHLGPAEGAGVVCISGGTVRFRHPLVRAAVYHGAALDRRLRVHRALAEALRGPVDADRRAWHLAAATTRPEEGVAAELERTAAKARARGRYAASAAAYERAAQLTSDPAVQASRLTLAAEAVVETGEFDRARGLAARVVGQTSDPIVQARLASVRARGDFAQGRLPTAHRLLVEGAAQAGKRDPARAARMLMDAVHIAWFLGDRSLMAGTAEQLRARAGSVAGALVPLVQLMLRWASQAEEQPSDGLPRLADMMAQARRWQTGDQDDLAIIAMVCLGIGRNADARGMLGELVADARTQGRIGSLPALLIYLAQALVFDSGHRDALASASEALRIAQDTGQTQWIVEANAIMAYLAAVNGDGQRCRQLVDAALTGPATHATLAGTPWAPWALGLLELGCGRLDTALVHLETIFRGPPRYHGSALQSIPDLVEAAVRLGQPQRAAEPLARFSQWARRADTPSTDALLERCHALLDTDGDPERHYLAALKLHQTSSFQQARTQLLYGAWLRRARRKSDACTQLRAALDSLDRIDATPWAARARAELGATTPRSDRTGLPRLTQQELQVARLAAQGLSNRDIAAQLFLSPRTVAYHLYKAYPKLGITCRSQLDPNTLGL